MITHIILKNRTNKKIMIKLEAYIIIYEIQKHIQQTKK